MTPAGKEFRLNVWDFGGQLIHHATHQFFLTKNSLYVLVDDTRSNDKSSQDKGFKYWLEVIEALSDRSPVLIFQNKKGGRSKKIDMAGIKKRFPDVLERRAGNLEKPDAADGLRKAIEYHVQRLPHIGEEVPAKWRLIRDAIEERAKRDPYISWEDYLNIYREHSEFDPLRLSRYFHDLGVFLHFENDRRLKYTVILQNRWAAEAVFRILDDEAIKSGFGRFTAEDYERLWADSEYAEMHSELLAMMEKFELCYELPFTDPETWLAPQLLSPYRSECVTDWAQPADLVLSYRYEFLPKGLVNRLMVRLNRLVKQPDLAWSTGVLFEDEEDTQVLVEETLRGNEIVIRARGPRNKALLSVVESELDTVNASFGGLKDRVGKWVPCICTECRETASPELFEHKRLVQRKRDNQMTIRCPDSYEEVNVLELLDGLKPGQLPTRAAKSADDDGQSVPPIELNEEQPRTVKRTIRIFLASSAELGDDRDDFDLYLRRQNDRSRYKRNLEIVRCENFLDAMSQTRLQDEYNREIQKCDIFVSLFKTKTGKYTEEEFDVAHQTFQRKGKPLIYTYFKEAYVSTSANQDQRMDIISLWKFRDKLAELGHFPTEYNCVKDLKLQFIGQLERLLDEERL